MNPADHTDLTAWRASASTVAGISFADYRKTLLHETDEIRGFLNHSHDTGKFIISAPKGFGKTLLLIAKRLQLNERSPEILSGGELIERLEGSFRTVSKERTRELAENFEFWQLMWSYSLAISAINEYTKRTPSLKIPQIIQGRIDQFTEQLLRDRDFFDRPTKVFPFLLNADFKTRTNALNFLGSLGPLLDQIHSQVVFFVDNVDEYFSPVLETQALDGLTNGDQQKSNAIWVNAQLALCVAAYNLMRSRRHISVYCTVRQEAFLQINDVTDNAQPIKGVTLQIRYQRNDLKSIFYKNVEMMSADSLFAGKDQDAMGKFFGAAAAGMRHQLLNQSELPFNYIIRHTFFRPRDLMTICGALAVIPVSERTQERIREVIVGQSKGLVNDVFGEMSPFFKLPRRDALFSRITHNFLRNADIDRITAEYLQQIMPQLRDSGIDETEYSHPFSILYQIGMLGFVEASTKSQTADTQRFRMPDEVVLNFDGKLPVTRGGYLVHPALDQTIFEQIGQPYTQKFYRAAIIGSDLPWLEPKSAVFVAKGDMCGFSRVMDTEFYETVAVKLHEWAKITCGDLDFVEVSNGDSITLIDRSAEKLINSIELLMKRAAANDDPELFFRFGVSAGPINFESVERRIEGKWEHIDIPLGIALKVSARLEPHAPLGGILVDDRFLRALGESSGIKIAKVSQEQVPKLSVHKSPDHFSLSKGPSDPLIVSRLYIASTISDVASS